MNMLCATNYKLTPPTPAINLCFQDSHTTMPCYFNSLTGIFSVYGLGGRDLFAFLVATFCYMKQRKLGIEQMEIYIKI